MALLILGLLIFLGAHALPMNQEVRKGLVERFGELPYKGVFAVISLVGLTLIVIGYGKLQVMPGKNPLLFAPPTWMSHITLLLMVFSMILLVATYVPSNIKRIVKHPMLAAVKVWAFAHLLANGDLASVLLFGSFLAYAVVDRISMKRRAPSSAAVADGGIMGDVIAIVAGLALYVAFVLFLHEWLIGIAPVTVGS